MSLERLSSNRNSSLSNRVSLVKYYSIYSALWIFRVRIVTVEAVMMNFLLKIQAEDLKCIEDLLINQKSNINVKHFLYS